MKEIREIQGGYPRAVDYHLWIQNEMLTAANGMFKALDTDLVLAGCSITNNGNGTINIGAGLVYVSGEVLRFDGANNIIADGSKVLVKGGYVTSEPHGFADLQIRDICREAKAIIGDYSSSNQIKIKAALTNLKSYIADLVASAAFKGEKRVIVDLDGTFLTHFDASGLGIDAPYIGWALGNGNNDTPDYAGRTGMGAGRFTSPIDGLQIDYAAGNKTDGYTYVGEDRHRLTAGEIPKHRFAYQTPNANGSASGNAVSHPDGPLVTRYTDYYGNDEAHNNIQPAVIEHVIIKLY